MTLESELLAALTDEPTSTEGLYQRIGYAKLARVGLIRYAAFRAELLKLSAAGLAERHSGEDGATMWRRAGPPGPLA
jgi:hypothetical protein